MKNRKSLSIPSRGKRLIANSFAVASSSTLNQVLMFVTLPMLLATVGAVEYGIYSLATAAVGYFSVFSFAARNSVVKYSAEFEQERPDEVNAVFNSALGINAMLGLVVGGIVLVSGIFCEELFNVPAEHIRTAKFQLFIHAAAAFVLQPLSVFRCRTHHPYLAGAGVRFRCRHAKQDSAAVMACFSRIRRPHPGLLGPGEDRRAFSFRRRRFAAYRGQRRPRLLDWPRGCCLEQLCILLRSRPVCIEVCT